MHHLDVDIDYLQNEVILCEFSEKVSYEINTDTGL